MKYNELNHPQNTKKTRVGRGIGSGLGKTSGRGTKGQHARTGYTKNPGFAGGQNPLMQQLPKLPGFKSHSAKAENVFTDELEALAVKKIDANVLFEKGLISSPFVKVKLLTRGELKKAVEVELQGASKSSVELVEKAGGSFKKVKVLQRASKKESK
jgi:large subunit ribosomal protein L15